MAKMLRDEQANATIGLPMKGIPRVKRVNTSGVTGVYPLTVLFDAPLGPGQGRGDKHPERGHLIAKGAPSERYYQTFQRRPLAAGVAPAKTCPRVCFAEQDRARHPCRSRGAR